MSFGSLEVASIPRTQDYTTMKQNEDNKGAFQQMTLGEHAQKQSEQRTRGSIFVPETVYKKAKLLVAHCTIP